MPKAFVTGGWGFLGPHVAAELVRRGWYVDRTRIDCLRYSECLSAFDGFDAVVHLAADCGGILYNRDHPASVMENNLRMGLNVLSAARECGVGKVVNVGTVCSYPYEPPRVPFVVEDLWNGYPEVTNAPYGIAKKVVAELGAQYRKQYGTNCVTAILANLYGPGDRSDHVIPMLLKKFREDDPVVVWGTGAPTREFLHVKDAARAVSDVLEKYDDPLPLNIGSGDVLSVRELVRLLQNRFGKQVVWDGTKPDGQMVRKIDSGRARDLLGFYKQMDFETTLMEL